MMNIQIIFLLIYLLISKPLFATIHHGFERKFKEEFEEEFEDKCVPIHFRKSRRDTVEDELCTTQGKITEVWRKKENEKNFLFTNDPQMRAVLAHDHFNAIGLCFSSLDYLNKNNLVGKQIGLKLKALDSCNVIYVMWRFGAKDTIVITRKLNKNSHTHKDCMNEGYKTIAIIPLDKKLKSHNFHSINAEIKENILTVNVDERQIWQGQLEKDLDTLHGPVGIRSDHGSFIFQMDDWNSVRKNCPVSIK